MNRKLLTCIVVCLGALIAGLAYTSSPAAAGSGDRCPSGTTEVARYEWNDSAGEYELTEGGDVTLADVSANAPVDWTSTLPISHVVVKAGTATNTVGLSPVSLTGTVTDSGIDGGTGTPRDIGDLSFCQSPPIPVVVDVPIYRYDECGFADYVDVPEDIEGVVFDEGDTLLFEGASVTINATALPGYYIVGQSSWTYVGGPIEPCFLTVEVAKTWQTPVPAGSTATITLTPAIGTPASFTFDHTGAYVGSGDPVVVLEMGMPYTLSESFSVPGYDCTATFQRTFGAPADVPGETRELVYGLFETVVNDCQPV